MSKFCKICGVENQNKLLPYCQKCYYEVNPYDKAKTPIKQFSNKNKNTIARFSQETKRQILIRDKSCIFCKSPIADLHHRYFGNEANRTATRNELNQGVGVCRQCHLDLHSCNRGEGKRQEAIEYLLNINKI